jgi:hypothetical protein
MRNPSACLFDLGSRAALAVATLLLAACSGAAGDSGAPTPIGPTSAVSSTSPAASVPVPAAPTSAPAVTATASASAAPTQAPGAWTPPDAIFGDWHEDQKASAEGRAVFVPSSVNLGISRFRRTLHLGRDKSFSTLQLDPADAHYECAGTFAVAGPNVLSAQCSDPKKKKAVKITLEILDTSKDRLVVKMTP